MTTELPVSKKKNASQTAHSQKSPFLATLLYTHASESTMGWPRLAGSLKIYVFFAEYSLFYRALLQTRPIFLRSLLFIATPCIQYIRRS